MTDEELIERLGNIRLEGTQELCWNAAVRIVVLLKDKEELQDKLAKAVEALGKIAEAENWQADHARDALTELETKP